MKHFKRFLIATGIIVALAFIAIAFFPSKVHVEEQIRVNAPADLIFKKVNSLKAWESWSPFQAEDVEMTSIYEGPESGVGAKQTWKSKVNGDGSMEITQSNPYEAIQMELSFMPEEVVVSDWKFEKEGQSVKVTWSVDVSGLSYPMGRIFGLMMPSMMGNSFRKGLAELKSQCEAEYKQMMVYKTGEIAIENVPAWNALVIKDSSSCDMVGDVLGEIFGEVDRHMKEKNIECVGFPYAMYLLWDEEQNKFVVEAGFPVNGKPEVSGRIRLVSYPLMKTVAGSHFGAYESSYLSYENIEKYIGDHKLVQKGQPWEVYITDPETEPDMQKWETRIYYPVE